MQCNPFEPPRSSLQQQDCTDRVQRQELAFLIRRFLNDEVTAFEFDESLDEFRDSSDATVRFVTDAVWHYYDDCDNHLVTLTKPQWDYFQRLLLLLESNFTTVVERQWHWSMAQPVAAMLLIVCVCIVAMTGFGNHLYLCFIPFGIASILLSLMRQPSIEYGPFHSIMAPFENFQDLRIAYESSGFKKRRYPVQLNSRQIRSPVTGWFYLCHYYVMWIIHAPIPLALQVFPVATTRAHVSHM